MVARVAAPPVALEAASSYLKLLETWPSWRMKWSTGRWRSETRAARQSLPDRSPRPSRKQWFSCQNGQLNPTLRAIFLGKRSVSICVSFCACPIRANQGQLVLGRRYKLASFSKLQISGQPFAPGSSSRKSPLEARPKTSIRRRGC